MKKDRERLDQDRGPRGGPRLHNCEVYAKNIFKHFNAVITAYTQYEYALQDFLQYR